MTRSRSLTAFEHQSIPFAATASEAELSFAEADALAALDGLRPGFCERSYRTVRLAQYCGVVNIGNRVLEILPKVHDGASAEDCRGFLLGMLKASDDFPVFRHLVAEQHLRTATLLEIFIAAFLETVQEIVRGGLLRRYENREDDLRVLRGRVAAVRQFGVHANRGDVIACQFDELTPDHVWNRLVKAGLRIVQPWINSEDLHRHWLELFWIFEEVDDRGTSADQLRHLVYDRQAARYRSAMVWIEWIFTLLSPSLRAGRSGAPGLLFDMNRLFESSVASQLRRSAGSGLRIETQEAGTYLATIDGAEAKREFGLRPDLMLRRGAKLLAIADTKWKRVQVNPQGFLKPDEGDLYQMVAYATAYDCNSLGLIYPWHDGLKRSRETTFLIPGRDRNTTVHVICVDFENECFSVRSGTAASPFGSLLPRSVETR